MFTIYVVIFGIADEYNSNIKTGVTLNGIEFQQIPVFLFRSQLSQVRIPCLNKLIDFI